MAVVLVFKEVAKLLVLVELVVVVVAQDRTPRSLQLLVQQTLVVVAVVAAKTLRLEKQVVLAWSSFGI